MVLIGLSVIFLSCVEDVAAANAPSIYVNGSSGNDSWDGQIAVWNGTSGPKATINSGVNTVQYGGTVYIASGIYNETNININKDMTIKGQNQQSTIVNGNNIGRIFIIQHVIVNIYNLTLANGTSSFGGAISNQGRLTLNYTTLRDNSATSSSFGGAINNLGVLNIDNSIITNNTAPYGGFGGAINNDGTLIINNSYLINNSAGNEGFGGAIFNSGSCNITSSILSNNNAFGGFGGAILNSEGILNINNSIFTCNSAGDEGFGGAINNDGTLIINNSNFINNSAGNEGFGGAILNGGSCSITSSILSNNNAIGGFGGAISNSRNLNVTSSIFTGNTIGGSSFGSSIFNGGGSVSAPLNYWGSNSNPSSNVLGMSLSSWLILTIKANPNQITNNGYSIITIDLIHDNLGNTENITLPHGMLVYFNTTLGIINNSTYLVNGIGNSILNSGTESGVALISATLYNQTVQTTVKIDVTPTVSANTISGLYNTTQNVLLTISEPGTIYYTTDGTEPTTSSNIYTEPLTINTTTTLKYIAIDLAGNISPIYTETYTIDTTSPTISSNINSGLYNTPQNIILTISEPGTIYYTTDGTEPTTSSNIYTGPLTINTTTTLIYLAIDTAGNTSPLYTQTYTMDTTQPQATPNINSGVYNTNKTVELSMNENGTIYYTLNGTAPTSASSMYTGPISIKATTTLKYIAIDLAGNSSPIYTETYIIDKITPIVLANLKNGTYNTNKTVNLVMNKNGTIYYTLNGKTPTNASSKYTGPTNINSTTTLKYFAVDLAGNRSPVYTNAYTIDKTEPKIVSTTPTNNAKGVSLTTPITIKFSEKITMGSRFSSIYIKNMSTGKITHTIVTLSGNTLTIKMLKSRLYKNNYKIYIPKGAVKDMTGNNLKTAYLFNFKTGK